MTRLFNEIYQKISKPKMISYSFFITQTKISNFPYSPESSYLKTKGIFTTTILSQTTVRNYITG